MYILEMWVPFGALCPRHLKSFFWGKWEQSTGNLCQHAYRVVVPWRGVMRVSRWVIGASTLIVAVALTTSALCAAQSLDQVLDSLDLPGGLAVHLGCGNGENTLLLARGDAWTVQGLDTDPESIAEARSRIVQVGSYGRVSVKQLTGDRLPYVDNLVRLLVVEDACGISEGEMLRVTAPLGVVLIKTAEGWTKRVKAWPEAMDDWPQHFYDAANNAVSHDRLVGPPRRFQWIAEPEWMRSHMTMPSITDMVSAEGRIYTIEDRAPAEHPALPGEFYLVARDGFNGIVLWKKRLPDWQPVNIRTKHMPVQIQRRLVAVGDRLYCTPGYDAPISLFDAKTGELIKVFQGTERTREFVYHKGILLVVNGDQTDTESIRSGDALGESAFPPRVYGPILIPKERPKSTISAIDCETGRTLWTLRGKQTAGYQGGSLGAVDSRVVYSTDKQLVCVELESGSELWRAEAPVTLVDRIGIAGSGVALVLSPQAAYLADSSEVRAFAMDDGRLLWRGKAILNHHKPADLFLADGVVWSAYSEGHDPLSGEIVRTIEQQMTGPMGHDRCYRNRITERFYINTKTGGSDFVDFKTGLEFPNPWIRSTCGIGHMPANGLLYCGPPACSCSNWVMLNAMNAVAPDPQVRRSGDVPQVDVRVRLERGQADSRFTETEPAPSDWPTYRHDAARSGRTAARGPADLTPQWEASVSTRPSAPVVVGGRLYVADVDAHAVCAFDIRSGSPLWRFTTGGRVDSPPTYDGGRLLFGSHDGWVYCVDAVDGRLIWRFKALPDRDICAYEQVESAWPVCGSILVLDDIAYFAAGRNSFLDGGVFVFGVEAQSGKLVYQRRMYGPYDENGFPVITSQLSNGNGIDGLKADILSTDGELLYMRHQAFKRDLTPLAPDAPRPPHLIPSAGFLEAIPHHRTYWTIDTTIRYDITAGKQAAHGDILVLDGDRFIEVRGYTPARLAPFDPRVEGYQLFAGIYRRVDQSVAIKMGGKNRKLRVFSKADELWTASIPIAGKALVWAADRVYVAGTPVAFPENDLAAAYEGRLGGRIAVVSSETGEKIAEATLPAAPVWDGMAVADGRLFVSLQDGRVLCLGKAR
ncbi:MAG: methyltransferase domain-containing protein [Planctomycetota bacterium]|nr:MAG: methyltransferase domain-containing protein [Planctomycetota bacterium]